MAKSIMIQGTGSNVGKSVITAGLCRIFLEDGYRPAPFKSQNMSNNSYVTADMLEIARSQANQAYACRIEPDSRMNPILLKPLSDNTSQVVLMGKSIGSMGFRYYIGRRSELFPVIERAYDSLAREYDIIVIEGAGSPAEVNLSGNDMVNMRIAEMAGAQVIIVGDIDNGGVFASFIGTMEIFGEVERTRTAGFIINKFRGDAGLLEPGIDYLEKKTGKKVFGVIPMMGISIPEEDAVAFKQNRKASVTRPDREIAVAVIDLPHISNFTDFDAFSVEEDVFVYTAAKPDDLEAADIVILPGTRNVIEDIECLRNVGLDDLFFADVSKCKTVIGICGGFQMLGRNMYDPFEIESKKGMAKGFGLLDIDTTLERDKLLRRTVARSTGMYAGELAGYEIRHGRSVIKENAFLFNDGEPIGCMSVDGYVWGTYLHGVFDNDRFRRAVINKARSRKGLVTVDIISEFTFEAGIKKIADALRNSLDMKAIYKTIGIG